MAFVPDEIAAGSVGSDGQLAPASSGSADAAPSAAAASPPPQGSLQSSTGGVGAQEGAGGYTEVSVSAGTATT